MPLRPSRQRLAPLRLAAPQRPRGIVPITDFNALHSSQKQAAQRLAAYAGVVRDYRMSVGHRETPRNMKQMLAEAYGISLAEVNQFLRPGFSPFAGMTPEGFHRIFFPAMQHFFPDEAKWLAGQLRLKAGKARTQPSTATRTIASPSPQKEPDPHIPHARRPVHARVHGSDSPTRNTLPAVIYPSIFSMIYARAYPVYPISTLLQHAERVRQLFDRPPALFPTAPSTPVPEAATSAPTVSPAPSSIKMDMSKLKVLHHTFHELRHRDTSTMTDEELIPRVGVSKKGSRRGGKPEGREKAKIIPIPESLEDLAVMQRLLQVQRQEAATYMKRLSGKSFFGSRVISALEHWEKPVSTDPEMAAANYWKEHLIADMQYRMCGHIHACERLRSFIEHLAGHQHEYVLKQRAQLVTEMRHIRMMAHELHILLGNTKFRLSNG